MVNFTLEKLARTVVAVADEHPGYIYTAQLRPDDSRVCLYWHDGDGGGCPGCIFGHAFHRLGVDMSTLGNWKVSVLLARWFGGFADDPLYRHFQGVQNRQDGAFGEKPLPWRQCVELLREAYPGKQR